MDFVCVVAVVLTLTWATNGDPRKSLSQDKEYLAANKSTT